MKTNFYKQICDTFKNCINTILKSENIQKFSIYEKGTDDLVTTLDISFEKLIIKYLKTAYPDIGILSEELNSHQPKQNTYFTIDPIDGTVNFARALPLYGIQLSYVEEGIARVAVIYIIPTKQMYYAIQGKGAYCNGAKITVTKQFAKDAIVFVDGNNQLVFAEFVPKLANDFLRVRMIGASCVEFTSVASGNAGGLLLIVKTPWDYFPGCLLVSEAGGYVKQSGDIFICGATQEIVQTIEKYI